MVIFVIVVYAQGPLAYCIEISIILSYLMIVALLKHANTVVYSINIYKVTKTFDALKQVIFSGQNYITFIPYDMTLPYDLLNMIQNEVTSLE